MPKVFIILLMYNSWQDTIECLRSLAAITYTNYSIIVVDNNSIDGSLQKIEKHLKIHSKLPVSLLPLDKNYGYAGGNNRGITKALSKGADYILILNPDTIVEPDFLTQLIEVAQHYKKEGKLALFGTRILLHENHIFFRDRGKRYDAKKEQVKARAYSNGGIIHPTFTKARLKDYGKELKDLKEIRPFETDYVSGTCLLVSPEAISKIGLMPEDYFLYYEDTDWSLKAARRGVKRVIVPDSIIWHKKSSSTKEFSYSYIYYHTRNGLWFAWWNGSLWQKLFALAFGIVKLCKQPFKLFFPDKRSWIKPVTRGVIDFLRGKKGKLK